jgi:predicted DNA-binding antitoxin AbrB/MazE fold protein
MALEAPMSITVSATYENGVLKPDAPLGLREKAKVRVTIEEPASATADDEDPAAWKAIDSLMGIGKAVAPDVSEKHDDHLYGDPRD